MKESTLTSIEEYHEIHICNVIVLVCRDVERMCATDIRAKTRNPGITAILSDAHAVLYGTTTTVAVLGSATRSAVAKRAGNEQ